MSTLIGKSHIVKINLNNTVYEKEAILAATYTLSEWCSNHIESGPDGYFYVTLEPLPEHDDLDFKKLEQRFLNELTDHQLRLDLEKRYGPLRVLIVRQAFSPLENLEAEVKRLIGRD
ncbi:MAG: His-Xaa-Ser system protein HxsD [Desulfobaccales bacterium]